MKMRSSGSVEPNNIYGLAAHDRIVLDASTVNADDIVY